MTTFSIPKQIVMVRAANERTRSSLMGKLCPNRGSYPFISTLNLSHLHLMPSRSSVCKSLKLRSNEPALCFTDSKRIVPVKSKWDKSNWEASHVQCNTRSNYGIFSLFLISVIIFNNAAKSGFRVIWISFHLKVIQASVIGMGRVRLRWCRWRSLTVNDKTNEPQSNDPETDRKGESQNIPGHSHKQYLNERWSGDHGCQRDRMWFTIWFVMGIHDPLRLGCRVSFAMEIFYICVHQCFIIFMCASVI